MERKNNTGAIFKNDFKDSDKHPDYKGKCLVDGVEKEVALWLAESKNGKKYFSMKIQDPYVKPERAAAPEEEPESLIPDNEEDTDDLPF